jgi:hypothetical protein
VIGMRGLWLSGTDSGWFWPRSRWARLRPHRIRGWVSINVINGLLRVRTTVRGLVVAAGHIVVLEPNESHAVLSGII